MEATPAPDTPIRELCIHITRSTFTGIISVTLIDDSDTMECRVPLGRTSKATLGKLLPVTQHQLWLIEHGFNEYTMAAFLLKCIAESAFCSVPSVPATPTTTQPTPRPAPIN